MDESMTFSLLAEEHNESIIDVLFDHYFETRGKDDPQVEDAYKKFCHSLLDVDPIIADEIMSMAALLCMEHERTAFSAGMKTRIRLLRELF